MNKRVGVIGAGTMGSGIAQKYASSGFSVTVLDANRTNLAASENNIHTMLESGLKKGLFDEETFSGILARLQFTHDIENLSDCSLVIEAVFEDMDVKVRVLKNLEAVVSPEATLATNTSSLRVTDIQNHLIYPARFLGLHYFFHPAKNKLVELIAGKYTDEAHLARAGLIQETIGKIVISSKDSPGFIVNRFFVPWLNEAMSIVHDNQASIASVEHAAKELFGIKMGPFELMNVTGPQITLHASNSLYKALGSDYVPCPLIQEVVVKNQLFTLEGNIEPNIMPLIKNRFLYRVEKVCQEILAEGVGTKTAIETGAKVGLAWPKGPLELLKENPLDPSLLKTTAKKNSTSTAFAQQSI